MIVWVATESDEVVNVACPDVMATVAARVTAPSVKVTLPVGVPRSGRYCGHGGGEGDYLAEDGGIGRRANGGGAGILVHDLWRGGIGAGACQEVAVAVVDGGDRVRRHRETMKS